MELLKPKSSEIGYFSFIILVVYLGHTGFFIRSLQFYFSPDQFLREILSSQNLINLKRKCGAPPLPLRSVYVSSYVNVTIFEDPFPNENALLA